MPNETPHPEEPVNQKKDWTPTPIDWAVGFPRSPQHLSNQLRGKRFNAEKPQLQLFDATYQNLPDDIRKDVDNNSISVIGFDLSVAQQRAYEAGLFLLTATGTKSQRIVFTPEDWLRAYGVQKRERNTRSKSEMSSYERDEAFASLVSLGMLPWLIQYHSFNSGKWHEVTRVAPLWLCGTQKDSQRPLPRSARALTPQDIAPLIQTFKNANLIELEFNPIWFDQHDTFYFYKPAQLYQRISLAISGNARRHNKHTHAFLDWIFSEVGRIRVEERRNQAEKGAGYTPRADWTFSEDMTALALQLRMTAQVSKRNWNRIRSTINDSAILAQQAQIISAFEWQGERLSITFNQKTFADLDQYQQANEARRRLREQRRNRRQTTDGVEWPFPKPVKDYSPNQLKELKLGQLAELNKIRQRLREGASHATNYKPRNPTTEEARALHFHDAVVKMIDDALVPKPKP
ncbi:MAG TPA: hypothetical protein VM008_22465 [Phycisphaerae bacterium]|nr:hypothetical protein [Phycisphaerae bacterium]